ncbi:hypothetical protein HK104_000201 [Borealophlyctis nickersoniae]|nr:hypothetical protein HK104_000201 [Borealophlyctis nickersoniae]
MPTAPRLPQYLAAAGVSVFVFLLAYLVWSRRLPRTPLLPFIMMSPDREYPQKLVDRAYIRLWLSDAPGAKGRDAFLPGPHTPTLQVYLPKPGTATGAICIVCPGGGYAAISPPEEGPPAVWLAERGITVFVLRYRVGPVYVYDLQLQDIQRAIRVVRYHASSWNLNPEQLAIMGFSAGGHLTSLASTKYDNGDMLSPDPISHVSSRPSLQILLYPVIDFTLSYDCCAALLAYDPNPPIELLRDISTHLHIRDDTPPAFVVHTEQDELVVIRNSEEYVGALEAKRIEAHFLRGDWAGHGFGMHPAWTGKAEQWLVAKGYARNLADIRASPIVVQNVPQVTLSTNELAMLSGSDMPTQLRPSATVQYRPTIAQGS